MMSLQTLLAFTLSLSPALALNIPRQDSGSTAVPAMGSTETYTGQITYYDTAGGTGACGTTLSDSMAIAAVSTTLYDSYTQGGNPNNNPLCGQKIQITYTDEASQATATATVAVADRCAACAPTDLDLTPTIFQQLVPEGLGVGRTSASWKFV